MNKKKIKKHHWFVKKTPSGRIEIWKKVGNTEYHKAVMRWTDGMNQEVENQVMKDAELIVKALNAYREEEN